MSICLGYATADRVLEELAQKNTVTEAVSASNLYECTANVEEVRELLGRLSERAFEQPELIVTRDSDRRKNDEAVCRRWLSRVPEGSIEKIKKGVFVSSPEFCLLQQARELPFVALCQMLGRYLATAAPAQKESGGSVLVERRPLTSEEKLSLYLADAGSIRGAAKLWKALRYTCANAASPQETNLQLALTLPSRYGGFGLPLPVLNWEEPLDTALRRLYDRENCRVDLYWRDVAAGLEYQGDEHDLTWDSDLSRFYALRLKGIELLFVAYEQLKSAVQMEVIAREVAGWLGVPAEGRWWPSEEKVQTLLNTLNGVRG